MPALDGYPRGTVAFLFTDIQDSTRLWQHHRAAMERAYARHDAILRAAIASEGGVVYKVVGDAVQAAFPSAERAVTAALEIQLGLSLQGWASLGLPEPLTVRMALHAGAVDPDPDGDYRSPVLNRLGRLLGAGHGGQVILSNAVQQLARDRLPEGTALKDLGEHRLKDLLEPERVWQLVHPALPADFPDLATLERRPHNLPLQPTPLVGRERQVAEVVGLLRRPEVRLLTLTGPGGIGKTRLALQAAAEVVDDFPDGVFFVPLAPVTDPELVASAIAGALGVRETGERLLADLVRDEVGGKALLLVLDNFEQVAAAAPTVGELLAAGPAAKVLVTSRTPLRLRAEREYGVPPLPLPGRRPPPTAAQLSQFEAVRLFIERAQAVRGDFAVDAANAPAIAEICHRLDGLPLAIELAAARVKVLPPHAMLARLEQRLPLLTGGARDLPLRQRTLRGAIAWSYDLLTENEQKLYRRLSVFAGGWTLDAAEAVAGSPGSGELGLDVLDGLGRLVDHSLVRQAEGAAGEDRFGMLETIREYGLEQLEATGEADEARERHAGHVLAVAERAEPELEGGPRLAVWLERLETEHDNLRAALAWALDHDPGSALRLAGAVYNFWFARGHLSEAGRWLEGALARDDGTNLAARAKALLAAAFAAAVRGDLSSAEARYGEALALARGSGDDRGVVLALSGLGIVAATRSDPSGGVGFYEEALALSRAVGDQRGIAMVSNNLGVTMARRGDLARAEDLLTESQLIERARGDESGLAYSLCNLGQVAVARGDCARAVGLLGQGLRAAAVVGLRESIVAEALAAVGSVQVGQDPAQAARFFGAADELVEAIGSFLDPMLPAEHARAVAAARAALGEERWAAAYAAGRALSLESAVAEALALAEEISGTPGGE